MAGGEELKGGLMKQYGTGMIAVRDTVQRVEHALEEVRKTKYSMAEIDVQMPQQRATGCWLFRVSQQRKNRSSPQR